MDNRISFTNQKNSLFNVCSDSGKLLRCVQDSHYITAKKLVQNNPQLIIETSTYTIEDKPAVETTPAKLAFKEFNTFLWELFLKTILGITLEDKLHLLTSLPDDPYQYLNHYLLIYPNLYLSYYDQIEEIPIKYPEVLKTFLQQENEQLEHIDLQFLFDAYAYHYEQYKAWKHSCWYHNRIMYSPQTTFKEFDQSMINIGLKQREILPAHMLNELCRGDALWSIDSNFNKEPRYDSYSFRQGTQSGLGFDYTIVRGESSSKYHAERGEEWYTEQEKRVILLNQDLGIFQRLYDKRRSELENLHAQSELALVQRNTMQL